MVSEESWDSGKLVRRDVYEDEREDEAVDDDDDERNIDEDEEDEEVREDVETLRLLIFFAVTAVAGFLCVPYAPQSTMSQSIDDEDDFDYEDRVFTMMKAQGRFNADAISTFTNLTAGVPEVRYLMAIQHETLNIHFLLLTVCEYNMQALALLRGILAMGGSPTPADIATLCDAVLAAEDKRHYASELMAILKEAAMHDKLADDDRMKLQENLVPVVN